MSDKEDVNTKPRIRLLTDSVLGKNVDVRQNYNYQRCRSGQIPSVDRPCDLGAKAVDDQDPDMTYRVFACPTKSCIDSCEDCLGGCQLKRQPEHQRLLAGPLATGLPVAVDNLWPLESAHLQLQYLDALLPTFLHRP